MAFPMAQKAPGKAHAKVPIIIYSKFTIKKDTYRHYELNKIYVEFEMP